MPRLTGSRMCLFSCKISRFLKGEKCCYWTTGQECRSTDYPKCIDVRKDQKTKRPTKRRPGYTSKMSDKKDLKQGEVSALAVNMIQA